MRRRWVLIGAVVLSCCTTTGTHGASNTGPPAPSTTVGEVEAHRRAWEQLGIDHYRIVYTVANPNGMGGSDWDGTHDIVVEDAEIVECSLLDNPFDIEDCSQVQVYPDTFRWLNLFEPEYTDVEYDATWHMPSTIFYDVPNSSVEEFEIRLISLEPID